MSIFTPPRWLVFGLEWPGQAVDGFAECALAQAPAMIPRERMSQPAGIVLDLAEGFIREQLVPGEVVFFSDITVDRSARKDLG